VCVCI